MKEFIEIYAKGTNYPVMVSISSIVSVGVIDGTTVRVFLKSIGQDGFSIFIDTSVKYADIKTAIENYSQL